MTAKVAGCCSKCDLEVFAVRQRDKKTGLPVRLGAPSDDAMRLTFLLMDGSRMDLTFCRDCASNLAPTDLAALWRRVMESWVHESPSHQWPRTQVNNGIVALLGAKAWKEVA
jgi:hypothetical protein